MTNMLKIMPMKDRLSFDIIFQKNGSVTIHNSFDKFGSRDDDAAKKFVLELQDQGQSCGYFWHTFIDPKV